MSDVLIVGAGLFGLTVAEQAAANGYTVTVLESRNHVGGNAWSYPDPLTGVNVHAYGSHIFHTSNARVWKWVNLYSGWTRYEHRVWTQRQGRVFPMPITLATINAVYGQAWTPTEARAAIQRDIQGGDETTLEGRAHAQIGGFLYDTLIKHYSAKQWSTPADQLPADVINRLPIRWNYDTRYFSDVWQALPSQGYGNWLNNIATSSERITINLNTPYTPTWRDAAPVMVWTGPVDEFHNYKHGALGWRTLDLQIEHHDVDDYQGCPVLNNADPDTPWTRTHEFHHYPPEKKSTGGTVIMREFPRRAVSSDDRYYPIRTPRDREVLAAYRQHQPHDVVFGGRLGTYKYLDMHHAIASALTAWNTRIEPLIKELS